MLLSFDTDIQPSNGFNGHIVMVRSQVNTELLSGSRTLGGVTFVMFLDKTAHLRQTRGHIMDI